MSDEGQVLKRDRFYKKSFSKDLVDVDSAKCIHWFGISSLIFVLFVRNKISTANVLLCIDKTFFKTFFNIVFKTLLCLKSCSIFDSAAKLCKAMQYAKHPMMSIIGKDGYFFQNNEWVAKGFASDPHDSIANAEIVFCCIAAWIQPNISGCQQDFLLSEDEISWEHFRVYSRTILQIFKRL